MFSSVKSLRQIYGTFKKFNRINIGLSEYCKFKVCRRGIYWSSLILRLPKFSENSILCENKVFLSSFNIPDYLKDIANHVPNYEEQLLEDEIEEQENSMVDEIIDFFLLRAIPYEELDSSFIIPCPSCGNLDKTGDMFLDKNSGYCVCPSCYWDGRWEELVKLFDSKEDCLTENQLEIFMESLVPLSKLHKDILDSFLLLKLNLSMLQSLNAGLTEDQSQLVLPLKGCSGTVGFASFPLLHRKPKVIVRLLEGKSAIFTNFKEVKTSKKQVVLISNIFDALHLAKMNIAAVVLLSDPNSTLIQEVVKRPQKMFLWLDNRKVSPSLNSYFKSCNIKTYGIRAPHDCVISKLSENKTLTLMEEAIPILSDTLLTFRDLEDKIYDRIINKDKVYGIHWKRFSELNEFLLGHRPGEVTVFSGPTGAGKTTFMAEYSLDLCTQGVATLWGSFEINVTRLCEVMMQQYYGSPLPAELSAFKMLAIEFSKLPLYFLNYHGQVPVEKVINSMSEAVLTKGIGHIVLDNLQFMLGLGGNENLWWLEQDRAVAAFRNFATTYNCHITLIVHPRKVANGEPLTLNSISGGARVTQEADNIMIINNTHSRSGNAMPNGPKVLQIVKNRYGGTLGEMKLNFHKESLTMSSFFNKSDIKSKELRSRDSLDGYCINVKGINFSADST